MFALSADGVLQQFLGVTMALWSHNERHGRLRTARASQVNLLMILSHHVTCCSPFLNPCITTEMMHAGQKCTEEGIAAAEGRREDPVNPDEEVPCAAAVCQDALQHRPNSSGGLGPICYLPWAPSGTDWIPR